MNSVDGFNNRLDTVEEIIMNWKVGQKKIEAEGEDCPKDRRNNFQTTARTMQQQNSTYLTTS